VKDEQPDDQRTPEPDAPDSPAERARAEAFARLVDDLLDGARPPPVMQPEERALLEAATLVHASTGAIQLDDTRRRALLDDVFGRVIAHTAPVSDLSGPQPIPPAPPPADDLAGRRSAPIRRPARLPWAIAAVCAAAALLFALLGPLRRAKQAAVAPARPLPTALVSRPADPLIGRIAREDSGEASRRADAIYADRLDAYRALRWGAAQ
jgi:hypothetical protein